MNQFNQPISSRQLTQPDQAQAEQDKLHRKLHEEWLRHPITQQSIRNLETRLQEYVTTLQEKILVESNEKYENKARQCINTLKAEILILTNTDTFVEYINKK